MINKIFNEPCLKTLKRMQDKSIDCVITSPPYWQLRDYGYDGQWGLEPTFQEYLEHLWEMMDEIHRVLKDEGTCWINLGDTYNGLKYGNTSNIGYKENQIIDTFKKEKDKNIKNKSLILIPHRFAIGCIDRGWIMRNDIIWAKRNGMPEPVTDRFTKKHEYIFFMVKSEKYFFDLDKIKIPTVVSNDTTKNPGSVSDFWNVNTKSNKDSHFASYNTDLIKKPILAGCQEGGIIYDPFMGTGTTAMAALRANRNFIGSEMSKEYIKICEQNITPYLNQTKLF
jgi:DNA modification methylase